MKLSYEDKVQIYELKKQGISLKQLSNKFGVRISTLTYMFSLIDRYGRNRQEREESLLFSRIKTRND